MMLSDGARGEKGSQRIRIHTDFSENLPCMIPQSRRRETCGQAANIQRYPVGDGSGQTTWFTEWTMFSACVRG